MNFCGFTQNITCHIQFNIYKEEIQLFLNHLILLNDNTNSIKYNVWYLCFRNQRKKPKEWMQTSKKIKIPENKQRFSSRIWMFAMKKQHNRYSLENKIPHISVKLNFSSLKMKLILFKIRLFSDFRHITFISVH